MMLFCFRTDLSGILNTYLSLVSWMKTPQSSNYLTHFTISLNIITMHSKFLSIVTFITAVVAVPAISGSDQNCHSGTIHCCNEIHDISSTSPLENPLETASDVFGHFIGLKCSPVAGQGAAGNDWSVVRFDIQVNICSSFSVLLKLYAAQRPQSVLFSFFLPYLSFTHFLIGGFFAFGCMPINVNL